MVSYYNALSPAMFPNPPQMGVARHQPTSASAAAAAAASHAYFHNYHAHAAAAYGHAHGHAHQYNYAAVAADLNSNNYGQNSATSHATPQFGAQTEQSWQNSWPNFGQNGHQIWPNSSDESPPSNENNLVRPSQTSPGNYAQSHSSGSPSGTPTPGGNAQYDYNFGGRQSPNSLAISGQNIQESSASPTLNNHLNNEQMASPVSLASPNSRPQPARSPYEWMKKPSYQSQPEKSGEFLKHFCHSQWGSRNFEPIDF